MPGAARQGDTARGPSTETAATRGSEDVYVNGAPVLRLGDGGPDWTLVAGARGVFINGRPVGRTGDATTHADGAGSTVRGSANVIIGDKATSSAAAKPVLRVQVTYDDGTPMSREPVQVLDAAGRVVAERALDGDGNLDIEDGLDWGSHRVRLRSGIILRLG